MPERRFDTGFWNSPFAQPKSPNAKLLSLYTWTNQHVNQAGLYEITMRTITWETGLDESTVIDAFRELYPDIVWFPDYNLVWVKFFVARQSRSEKFLTAAANCLKVIPDRKIIENYINFNRDTYGIKIDYKYPTDTLSIPSAQAVDQESPSLSASPSLSDKEIERGSGGEEKQAPEDPELAAIVTLYEQNIGIRTPMIAEELKDIRDHYPPGWFQAALKEALDHEARSLAYIKTVLQRWERDGFQSKKKEPPKTVKGSKRKLSEGID